MREWYCIYTKPNQADNVCRKLGELPEIEVFNPKVKGKKRVRSRSVEVVEDLFPCYVFSKFDPFKYFHLIQYTRGVRRFVGDRLGQPYTVDENIIDFIKAGMRDGFIHCEPLKLAEGDRITITDGPFSGLTGMFLKELKSHERIMILLNFIEYQARVEVPVDMVARV